MAHGISGGKNHNRACLVCFITYGKLAEHRQVTTLSYDVGIVNAPNALRRVEAKAHAAEARIASRHVDYICQMGFADRRANT